jgi:L-amino acid N-acyltransferase YncA
MIAVVGDANAGSLRLHKKHGFEIVGQLRSVGYKKGDWRDTVIMQRSAQRRTRCRNKAARLVPSAVSHRERQT